MNANASDRILDLENRIDARLCRDTGALKSDKLVGLVSEYAALVSERAHTEGPILPSASRRNRGMALAERPVFVCGVPRSGTTLMQALLHSHDHLCVLPSEGSFLTSFEPRLRTMREREGIDWLTGEWIARLIRINDASSHWTLGRSAASETPYVDFARSLLGWLSVLHCDSVNRNTFTAHMAVMLAFWSVSEDKNAATRWVDKTPYNENHVARLSKRYPRARFLHMLRDPRAIIASRLRIQRRAGLGNHNFRELLAETRRSLKLAGKFESTLGGERYLLVQYEQLADTPQATMERVTGFLRLDVPQDGFRPILHGGYRVANTSYADTPFKKDSIYLSSLNRFDSYLSEQEQQVISASLAACARPFGYQLKPASPGRRLGYLVTEYLHTTSRALVNSVGLEVGATRPISGSHRRQRW